MSDLIKTILRIKERGVDVTIAKAEQENIFATLVVLSITTNGQLYRQEATYADELLDIEGEIGLNIILKELFNMLEMNLSTYGYMA